ncbi:MAG TPA: hypothetical protein VIM28_05285 [Solirubrobacterales bacterium]
MADAVSDCISKSQFYETLQATAELQIREDGEVELAWSSREAEACISALRPRFNGAWALGQQHDERRRRNMKRIHILAAVLCACFVVISHTGIAVAKVRSCGELHGAQVTILHGPVKCRTARRVLAYALDHHRVRNISPITSRTGNDSRLESSVGLG